jgi:hypothetical protein
LEDPGVPGLSDVLEQGGDDGSVNLCGGAIGQLWHGPQILEAAEPRRD